MTTRVPFMDSIWKFINETVKEVLEMLGAGEAKGATANVPYAHCRSLQIPMARLKSLLGPALNQPDSVTCSLRQQLLKLRCRQCC